MNRWLLSLLAVLVSAGCSRNDQGAQVEASATRQTPFQVETALAETRRVEKSIAVTGELQADETVSVSFEVAGRVADISVDFGQVVRKGTVIATLDPQEYQIRLDRGRAMLAQALARIGFTPAQADETPATSPAIRQAEAQLADARSKFESASKLIKTGDIANERYVELEKSLTARQAAVDAAKDELRTLSANVQSLKADVRLLEKQLRDTVVRAPFDGAIAERMVSPGQFIKENTPVVRLVKSDPLRLRLEVPETATSSVRTGSTLTFTTDAVPGQKFRATVRRLNPSLDQKSRTMTAEALIRNPKSILRPGTFVQVELITAGNVEIVTVPKTALYNIAGLTKIFAIRDGKAVEFRVPPGMEGDSWVEVPGATVKPGEQVAVSNLSALIDQAPVEAK